MMGTSKRCLGYPSRTEAAIALAADGKTTAEIAELVGGSRHTVQNLLLQGRRAGKRKPDSEHANGPGPRCFWVDLDRNAAKLLAVHAAARNIRVVELAQRILQAAAERDLVDSVLDDGEGS